MQPIFCHLSNLQQTKMRKTASGRICIPHYFAYVQQVCFCFLPSQNQCSRPVLSGWVLVPHSAIPLHTALSHGLEKKQNCIPLFARQTPQKIPSLWIQFWNRKSCKSRKFFSVFLTFVGMHKRYHKNLWIFACNSREKIYIFLKKAFSFS